MNVIAHRQQQVLCDRKWRELSRRAWLFKYVPFVDFVLGGGSLAVGNVDAESDFDVLVGVRSGRIFTARFFSAFVFGIPGWRRKKMDHHDAAANKICFNHFTTPSAYRLRLPVNRYWEILYKGFTPIYGTPQKIQEFFDANSDWLPGLRTVDLDGRYRHRNPSGVKRFIEVLLDSSFGVWLEEKLKGYQVRRIEAGLTKMQDFRLPHHILISGEKKMESVELPPLIIYSDEELEFHPDPALIEFE